MTNEIKVPVLPESITEGTVASWYKNPGESVKRDEHLVDIETDKVVLEVVAPGDGILEKILKEAGSTVKSGEIIGIFQEGASKADRKPSQAEAEKPAQKMVGVAQQAQAVTKSTPLLSPGARQLSSEYNIDTANIEGTGKGGRVTRADIMQAKASAPVKKKEAVTEKKEEVTAPKQKIENETATKKSEETSEEGGRIERRVPMTRLRARIAERLLAAKQNTALLTTFNEINMQPVMSIRNKYKEQFEKTHGVRLGLMSFFTVAVVEALKQFPIINASVDGNDIVYHGYYDIGIAVSTPRGLVVPILRNAESMTMADIERKIAEYGEKAQSGHLSMEDITGGTFTISNGGVFGSLMSTPILNPPQSAILGMHKILERPIADAGQVVIRPMMYVALSYDHRIIDGADSVRFLLHVKELIEEPARIALGI